MTNTKVLRKVNYFHTTTFFPFIKLWNMSTSVTIRQLKQKSSLDTLLSFFSLSEVHLTRMQNILRKCTTVETIQASKHSITMHLVWCKLGDSKQLKHKRSPQAAPTKAWMDCELHLATIATNSLKRDTTDTHKTPTPTRTYVDWPSSCGIRIKMYSVV